MEILREKGTFLYHLTINDCNILLTYLSIYFTTNKKVSILGAHCVYPLSF